ncbi:hypothetical protein T10_725 [Trichinella papuae]|uniref:Uncharacterized protein n=1 Tax=Trichinella papuae TaxID=268474 RepID=A0A0V1M429_9BILA|nr:hypothetical protein T10_725 [Trichinella papuae]
MHPFCAVWSNFPKKNYCLILPLSAVSPQPTLSHFVGPVVDFPRSTSLRFFLLCSVYPQNNSAVSCTVRCPFPRTTMPGFCLVLSHFPSKICSLIVMLSAVLTQPTVLLFVQRIVVFPKAISVTSCPAQCRFPQNNSAIFRTTWSRLPPTIAHGFGPAVSVFYPTIPRSFVRSRRRFSHNNYAPFLCGLGSFSPKYLLHHSPVFCCFPSTNAAPFVRPVVDFPPSTSLPFVSPCCVFLTNNSAVFCTARCPFSPYNYARVLSRRHFLFGELSFSPKQRRLLFVRNDWDVHIVQNRLKYYSKVHQTNVAKCSCILFQKRAATASESGKDSIQPFEMRNKAAQRGGAGKEETRGLHQRGLGESGLEHASHGRKLSCGPFRIS